jgi:flagellar biosynthesis/type III secretory pathway M-ring protein FliF/YscJ
MRVIHGVANAVLMVTLVKPMARLAVRRWRRQAQESRAAAIGVPMQELFEAALVEELAPAVEALAPTTDLEPALAEDIDVVELVQAEAGRSFVRVLLMGGLVIVVTTAAAYGIVELIRRRREAEAAERELVAVPVEGDDAEALDDLAPEVLVEEG